MDQPDSDDRGAGGAGLRPADALDRVTLAAVILARRVAAVEQERDRARALAVAAVGIVDWRTPGFMLNPENAADAIRMRGIAIYEPNPLRDHPQLFDA